MMLEIRTKDHGKQKVPCPLGPPLLYGRGTGPACNCGGEQAGFKRGKDVVTSRRRLQIPEISIVCSTIVAVINENRARLSESS